MRICSDFHHPTRFSIRKSPSFTSYTPRQKRCTPIATTIFSTKPAHGLRKGNRTFLWSITCARTRPKTKRKTRLKSFLTSSERTRAKKSTAPSSKYPILKKIWTIFRAGADIRALWKDAEKRDSISCWNRCLTAKSRPKTFLKVLKNAYITTLSEANCISTTCFAGFRV